MATAAQCCHCSVHSRSRSYPYTLRYVIVRSAAAAAECCHRLIPPPTRCHFSFSHRMTTASQSARALHRATHLLHTFSAASCLAPPTRPLSLLSTLRSATTAMSAASPTHAGFQLPADAPKGSAPIQLYSLATPNGQKVGIMLEELGLPYDAHLVDISKNVQFEEWFKAICPNSKIPSLVDLDGPDGKPIALFESAAILIYLAEKTGKSAPDRHALATAVCMSYSAVVSPLRCCLYCVSLRFLPRHGAARYEVLQWLEWQMGGVGPMLGQVKSAAHHSPHQHQHQHALATRNLHILVLPCRQVTELSTATRHVSLFSQPRHCHHTPTALLTGVALICSLLPHVVQSFLQLRAGEDPLRSEALLNRSSTYRHRAGQAARTAHARGRAGLLHR